MREAVQEVLASGADRFAGIGSDIAVSVSSGLGLRGARGGGRVRRARP